MLSGERSAQTLDQALGDLLASAKAFNQQQKGADGHGVLGLLPARGRVGRRRDPHRGRRGVLALLPARAARGPQAGHALGAGHHEGLPALRRPGDRRPDEADFNVSTGCVVRDDRGVHHLYYTGQNPGRLGADGRPLQVVRRATSTDGMTSWVRDGGWELRAPDGYETADWRDPFVVKDERTGVLRMLVAGRHTTAPLRRRGVIAQLTSTDLTAWHPAEPFWDPR